MRGYRRAEESLCCVRMHVCVCLLETDDANNKEVVQREFKDDFIRPSFSTVLQNSLSHWPKRLHVQLEHTGASDSPCDSLDQLKTSLWIIKYPLRCWPHAGQMWSNTRGWADAAWQRVRCSFWAAVWKWSFQVGAVPLWLSADGSSTWKTVPLCIYCV